MVLALGSLRGAHQLTPLCRTAGAGRKQFAYKCSAMQWGADRKNHSPRPQNVDGSFYVDHSCIDCDTCRWMAPDVFSRVDDQSAVTSQPTTHEGRIQALRALLSCPTFSIHARDQAEGEMREAVEGMPIPVEGCPDVYHTGFASESSYAGTAYLIVRKEGNILVDSPRFHPKLRERIKAMGGFKYMFLTHRDDVGDHAKWKSAFPDMQRIIHKTEVNNRQGTTACEVQLEGEGPWQLPGGSDDVEFIFTPGHTEGCVSLLHRPSKALFSGDHLAAPSDGRQGLSVFREVNWYSFPVQLESVHKLLPVDFLHVLPAHGRRRHLRDAADRVAQLNELLQMEGFKEPAMAT